nr:hypothetical protein [Candidatus Gracilibacteria bacterium]
KEHSSMRVILSICILLAVYQMYTYAVKSYQDYQINQQIHQSDVEIQNLEQDNRMMQEYLKYLDSEAYKEKEAKRIKNVRNANEDVFVIKQAGLEKVSSEDDQAAQSWNDLIPRERWWRFFLR